MPILQQFKTTDLAGATEIAIFGNLISEVDPDPHYGRPPGPRSALRMWISDSDARGKIAENLTKNARN